MMTPLPVANRSLPASPVIPVVLWITLLVAGAAVVSAYVEPAPPLDLASGQWTEHLIDSGLAGGYQVVVADMNRDGKPDVIALASGLHELRWYENPGWQRHVIISGIANPINAAVYDVDGDGIPEIALVHEFDNVYARSRGIVSILTHNGDPTFPWSSRAIDSLPTSHRVRFVDIDGSRKRVLVNFPLIGALATAPEYRDRVPLVMYRPGEWKREMITDADEGVVHGIFQARWNGDARESLLSASFRGVHRMRYDMRVWTRTKLVDGDPGAWPSGGASEIAVGRIGRDHFLATIEPWHGNKVVVYRRASAGWTRHVIDESIADGHTLVVGDFDADGQDEIVAGERGGKRSVYVYRATDRARDTWTKQVVDDGGMAAAGCAAADMDRDTRPDIVCIGTATTNLKWYENRAVSRSVTDKSSPRATVLFVCEHGTVRSLLAKVLFEQYAAEVGLPMQAVSRGTRADSIVPAWMQQGLAADHVELGAWRPQTLRAADLKSASLVVSFDVPATAMAAARGARTQWDNLPSVSRDYPAGRDAIKARVHQLVDSLKHATRPLRR